MARPHSQNESSSYYPPRARWYAPLFYLGGSLRRRLALDRLTLPGQMKVVALIAGFFVPGLAIWLRKPRFWGILALAGGPILGFIFFAFIGYPVSNLALGLLISLHALGLYYYCNPFIANESFGRRLAFALLILMAVGLLLYAPARNLIQRRWLLVLNMRGHVFVVERMHQFNRIHRGDWVAYELHDVRQGSAYREGAVIAQSGLGLGPVLAVAGDRVDFSTNGFFVNGALQANLPHLPTSGEFIVPENHWFIWPNLDISGHGNVSEANITQAMLSLADVSETQLFGRPFRQWFWRQQVLP